MPDYNKGDFTQQGIDGFVEGGLHLNEKRCLTAKISTDEDSAGLDSVEINIHDHLNDLDYTITGENLVVGENTIGSGGGGGGGFPTCEITLIPQAGGSCYDGYDAIVPKYCLDANGQVMASISNYQTNLVVNGLYLATPGGAMVSYNNTNKYTSEAEALASVTDKVNITVVAFENNGNYYVRLMPTDDTLPSSCTMTGNGEKKR